MKDNSTIFKKNSLIEKWLRISLEQFYSSWLVKLDSNKLLKKLKNANFNVDVVNEGITIWNFDSFSTFRNSVLKADSVRQNLKFHFLLLHE